MVIRIVKLVNREVQWADTIGPASTDAEASASLLQARQLLKFLGIGWHEATGRDLLGGDSQYDTWKRTPDGVEFRIQKVMYTDDGTEIVCDYARRV